MADGVAVTSAVTLWARLGSWMLVRSFVSHRLWPDEMTAIGTVALAFVTFIAIIVTIVIARRDRRNAMADAQGERDAADARLDRQIAASASQLEAERAAADDRLQNSLSRPLLSCKPSARQHEIKSSSPRPIWCRSLQEGWIRSFIRPR
jgi:hypothetical protein